jgi:hypothetical protein
MTCEDELEDEIFQFERLQFMVSLKEMWSPSRIQAEASNIEDRLFKTTQRLMRLERQYRQENGVSGGHRSL